MASLWGHRDFRRLWAGDTISQFGSTIGNVAIPLLAVGALAATPFEMGLLTAAETAAFLLVGLPAGTWVDRLRRRPLMLRADLGRAALLVSVPVAAWLGWLTFAQLVVVALLVGVLTVFFDVAYQSYLPSLVGREHLMEGNSKLQTSQSVAQVTGPTLSGWLAQAVGAANAVLGTGLGYLASAAFLWRIRKPEPQPEQVPGRNLRADIAEGLRFVLRHPLLRAITAATATCNLFGSIDTAMQVLFLRRELNLGAGTVGMLLAAAGLGGVLGALTATWWSRRFGQARTIWLIMVLTQPLLLLVPLTQRDWRLALYVVGMLSMTYGAVVYNVAQVSFRQAICPDRLLGRMNASVRFLVWGTMPVGGLLGGLLGQWLGVRPTLWVAAVGGMSGVLWLVISPLRRLRDLPDEATTDATQAAGATDEPATA